MSADNYAANYILEQLRIWSQKQVQEQEKEKKKEKEKESVIEVKLQIAFLNSHIGEEILRLRKCIDEKVILRLISGTDIVQLMESNLKEQLSLLGIDAQNRLPDISSLIGDKKTQISETKLKALQSLFSDIKDNHFLRNYKFEAAKSRKYEIPPSNSAFSIVNDLEDLLLQQSITGIEPFIAHHYFQFFSPDDDDDDDDDEDDDSGDEDWNMNYHQMRINGNTHRKLTFREIDLKIEDLKKDIEYYKMKKMNRKLDGAEQELQSFVKLKNSLIYRPRNILKSLKSLLSKHNINIYTNIDDRIKNLKHEIEYNKRKNNQKQLRILQLEEIDLIQIKELYSIIKSPHFTIMTIESEISDYRNQNFFKTEDDLESLIRSTKHDIFVYQKRQQKGDVEKKKKYLRTALHLRSLFSRLKHSTFELALAYSRKAFNEHDIDIDYESETKKWIDKAEELVPDQAYLLRNAVINSSNIEIDSSNKVEYANDKQEQPHVNKWRKIIRFPSVCALFLALIISLVLFSLSSSQNSTDMYNLAMKFQHGDGVEKNELEALKWMRKAADHGHVDAMYNLGLMYANGTGVEKNESKATMWYMKAKAVEWMKSEAATWMRKAADHGHVDAMYNLGLMYANGKGVEKKSEAATWMRKAADHGHVDAMYNLGVMYANGTGVEKNESKSATWMRKASDLYNLGAMYVNGDVIEKNDSEASKWMRKATDLYNLGLMYINGDLVAKNDSEAVKWIRKAADHGHANAMYNLGLMYANGKGVEKNESKSATWCMKAADRGHVDAMYNLGLMYANGTGVEKNESIAATWYMKAADHDHADAMYKLGLMYANGKGVEKNESIAATWMRKAADHGHADAMYNLGLMYANGKGVEKNESKAATWMRKAADHGHADAMNKIKKNSSWFNFF